MSRHEDEDDPFMTPLPNTLSIARACGVLGISRRTAYYMIKDGRMKTLRTPLGSQRVLTDCVKSLWLSRS